MFIKSLVAVLVVVAVLRAQQIQPTAPGQRLQGFKLRLELQQQSLVRNIPFTSIGPAVMSGRVVDIDVNPVDPTIFYVAYASGGLWKTTNNGVSFSPVFDHEASMVIGDIAVDWNNNLIYVGTGENNSSRSSYSGTGLYRSSNGGSSWEHIGLAAINRTGRVILHPEDKNTLFVAALGNLYTAGRDRGVYRTRDGGKNWEQVLFVNDSTGAVDIAMDPVNPNILYAAMWQRARAAWNFVESGAGSAIYKSTDGGSTWMKITGGSSGFPGGHGVGRIGISIYSANPSVIFALLDNQERRPKIPAEAEKPVTRESLLKISSTEFLDLPDEDINSFLDDNSFPDEYTAAIVKGLVKSGKIEPSALVEYLGDANTRLFDTPVIGAELYRSTNAGASWEKTSNSFIDDFYYSYGYYFGGIRVHPADSQKVFILGVPVLRSDDGGKSFTMLNDENAHSDHHALWINPSRPGHIILGNDGGVNVSYDDGKTWFKGNTPAVGQFYSVAVDDNKPFNVYGGLQDNGVWYGPVNYKQNYEWYQTGQYPYKSIMGGDGMQVAVDTRDNATVYTGYQFGFYYRLDLAKGTEKLITPVHKLGETPYRFNWQTPIHLSSHNMDILYFGSSRLFRSMDKGDSWTPISPDLTGGGKPGDVPYGTLTTISESPLRFGVIYTGSDDGFIHCTTNGGASWHKCSTGLPRGYWVSRVEASHFDTSAAYVALNGYRFDNMEALVFRTTDFGQSWQQIGKGLPPEPVNVVREDPVNPDIIYVGTDNGMYVSLNRGSSFMALGSGLPAVAVHDLVIHKRDHILIAATHGRSLYKADVALLQELNSTIMEKPLHLFPVEKKKYSKNWGKKGYTWGSVNTPSIQIPYYSSANGVVAITIKTDKGIMVAATADTAEAGLNFFTWNGTVSKELANSWKESLGADEEHKPADDGNYYIRPGRYSIQVQVYGASDVAAFMCEAPEQKVRK